MKNVTNRFACALLVLLALFASVASAKVTSRTVTFGQDFSVGGTLVKAGTYRLSFDDETNELSVLDKKTKAVIAKAAATMEKSDAKRGFSEIKMVSRDGRLMLSSVGMPGTGRMVKIGGDVTASAR